MNFLDKCSILTGVVTLQNEIFVSIMNDGLAEERQQHAIPLFFNKEAWALISDEPVLPWLVSGIACNKSSSLTIYVGWGGQVLVISGDKCHREAILRKDSNYVSIMRSVVAIGDVFYAVGMRRQVYKRTGESNWVEIDHGVVYLGDRIDIGFNAIDGYRNNEIYAVGSNGELWLYNNKFWQEIQTPTNVHLHSLYCAPDGYVYIGGTSGVLIRGRHDSWEIVDIDFKETIWDIHYFENKLYLITSTGIYFYLDNKIEKVQNVLLDYKRFLRFSSSKDRLWVFGEKKIVQFDGLTWSECVTVIPDDALNSSILGFFNDDVLLTGSDYLEN